MPTTTAKTGAIIEKSAKERELDYWFRYKFDKWNSFWIIIRNEKTNERNPKKTESNMQFFAN